MTVMAERGIEYSCFDSERSIGEVMDQYAWERFSEDVLDKGSALKNLIESFEYCFIPVGDERISSAVCQNGHITTLKILNHLEQFLDYRSREDGIDRKNIDETNKHIYNKTIDILRCLRRMRDNEPLFLLPQKDREDTFEFIKGLEYPPRDVERIF